MLIDLILKPYNEKVGKHFLWMDNCGPRKTPCLNQLYAQAATTIGLFPPNMTASLQVLDLVVNGPIKAHIRRLRAKTQCEYFRDFRAAFRISTINQYKNTPKWEPPRPSLPQCLLDLIMKISKRELGSHSWKLVQCTTPSCSYTKDNKKPINAHTLNQKKFTFTEQDLIDLTLDNLESPDAYFEDENNDDDHQRIS